MKNSRMLVMLVAVGCFFSSPAEAGEAMNAANKIGNSSNGKAKSALCVECHGEDGNSTSSGYPKLAGQKADYLIKQLRDFRTGARKNPFMNPMASKLKDEEVADVAVYFSEQTRTRSEAATSEAGKRLFLNGEKSRNLPACAGCHGGDGNGLVVNGMTVPAVSGQHYFYLREQLFNWQLGLRNNSPDSMNAIGKSLTDADIDALARYMAGL